MGGAGLGALVGFPLKITIGRRFFLGSLNSTSRNTRHRTGLSVGEDPALPTSSVSACSSSPRIVDARTFAAGMGDPESAFERVGICL
jgi:hypothetical protein